MEIEAEQGQEDAGRLSATLLFLNGRRQMSDFPFFALGFAAVVSECTAVFSDLEWMNGRIYRRSMVFSRLDRLGVEHLGIDETMSADLSPYPLFVRAYPSACITRRLDV